MNLSLKKCQQPRRLQEFRFNNFFSLPVTITEQTSTARPALIRRTLLALLALVVTALVALYVGRQYLVNWSLSAGPLEETNEIVLARGTTLKSFARKLEQKGFISNSSLFHGWVRIFSDYSLFQAGRYQFQSGVTPAEIATAIISGNVFTPILLTLTIPEGFTLRMLADRLQHIGVGSRETILDLGAEAEFLSQLKIPSSSVEGYLYPATYRFYEIPKPQEAIKKIVDTFWSRLPADYEQRVNELGLSLNEAVIFASLIELETSREEEKGVISEVIWNRLRRKMTLGIDASLIYGIEDYEGRLTRSHLRDASNVYNTRIHAGLPPTAIGSPSLTSLLAVLNPTNHGYLYYVVDAEDFSRHRFAKTLAEHNKNVRSLVRAGHGR